MDKNPLGGAGGKGTGKIPGLRSHTPDSNSSSDSARIQPGAGNSNFESMPNDGNEEAFKAPGFGKASDDEKKGIANRIGQAQQAGKEIGATLAGAAGKNSGSSARRPKAEDDKLTAGQREAVDTAKLGIKAAAAASALIGNEKGAADAAKEMAEHPIETLKEVKSASKFLFKIVLVGCLVVTLGVLLLFSVLSNFSQKHTSTIVKDTVFVSVDVTGARRVAQIFSDTLFGDSQDSFDVVKVLTNLGENERVKFHKNQQEISLEEFTSTQKSGGGGVTITIGSSTLNVPANLTKSSSPETIKFIKDLEIIIKSTNLFANDSRIFRSPSAKQIYKQFGINLFRWENKGKDIKTYSDNMKSLYNQVKDLKQTDTDLKDVDNSGKKLDSVTEELLGKEISRSQKSVAIKTADIAWKQETGEESLSSFSKKATSFEFVVASYCTAKSYVKNYDTIVTQKFVNSQRSAIKLLSSDDQIMVGDSSDKAVSTESQQMEFFENARPYLKAINSDVTNRRPILNEGQLAYQDPRIIKAVMEGIINLVQQPLGDKGVISGIANILFPDKGGGFSWDPRDALDNLRSALDFTKDAFLKGLDFVDISAATDFIADKVYPILCSNIHIIPGDGPLAQILNLIGSPLQASLLQGVKDTLNQYKAYELRNQLGLDKNISLFSQPTENFMKFMYRTQKTIEYSGLDDGAELISKDFEGVAAFGNELSRIGGGRPLALDEQLAITEQKNERNYAVLKQKPISYRLFSLDNQYSPVSIVAARSPKSFDGAAKRTQSQFASIFSPIKSYGGSVNKAIAAAIGDRGVVHALGTNDEYDKTVMFGYSTKELKQMHEDISFWPKQNRQYVEENLKELQDRFDECFNPQNSLKILYDSKINMWSGDCTADRLKGDEALHYRLYLLDNLHENSLKDIETVTKNTSSDSGPSSSTGQLPTGDSKETAKKILASGNITGTSSYMKQIEDIANGTGNCHVNPTILSLLDVITQKYKITISSLNRFCTKILTESGPGSFHYKEGGGHAVDISVVNGVSSTGRNPNDLDLLNYVLPLLPIGSGIGQSNCRTTPISLPKGVVEFTDTCNHIHIQVPVQ